LIRSPLCLLCPSSSAKGDRLGRVTLAVAADSRSTSQSEIVREN
jgi:hypothetical protein